METVMKKPNKKRKILIIVLCIVAAFILLCVLVNVLIPQYHIVFKTGEKLQAKGYNCIKENADPRFSI